LSKSRNHQN